MKVYLYSLLVIAALNVLFYLGGWTLLTVGLCLIIVVLALVGLVNMVNLQNQVNLLTQDWIEMKSLIATLLTSDPKPVNWDEWLKSLQQKGNDES